MLTIQASRMYRMPEKQSGSQKVLNSARSCFHQYANHLPDHLLSIELKYAYFFYHFSICFVSFYILLCKLSSFMRFYAFKRKKTLRKRCVYNHGNSYLFCFTYTYMQVTVHLLDFTGDKNVDFEFPDACFFGHPFYFGYQDFIG